MRRRLWALVLWVAAVGVVGCGANAPTAPGGTATGALPAAAASNSVSAGQRLLNATPGTESTAAAPDFEALPGATAYFGTIGRAAYRIEIPSRWNGELLLWAHGVHGFGPEVSVENPPPALRAALVNGGYAWAASSYSENGYAAGVATNDTLTLKRYFARRFGAPRRTYIAGSSLGGNVVVVSLENFPEEYDGGLALCGAVAGEEEVDYLLAWALAAEFFAGHQFQDNESPALATEVLQSITLPALGPVEAPTARGQAFESVIRNLTGGPRPFFGEGYRTAYAFNFGLITGDPGRISPVSRAATNLAVEYRVDPAFGFDLDALNRAVPRLAADPRLRDPALHPDTAPTTGHLARPLLTLHETGDLTVPFSAEQSYREKADAAGSGGLLVQRIIRDGGHCEFSADEITHAWHDLADWVAAGKKPPGDDVAGDLSNAGLTFTNPLRPGDPGGR